MLDIIDQPRASNQHFVLQHNMCTPYTNSSWYTHAEKGEGLSLRDEQNWYFMLKIKNISLSLFLAQF